MDGVHGSRNNGGRTSRHDVARVKRGVLVGREGNSVGREGNDFFRPCSSAFNSFLLWFCLVLFLLVILCYQPIRVKILPWFPGVVARGIALPLNQEVHLAPSASWL